MDLPAALRMIAPFKEAPHYDDAVARLHLAALKGKRELSRSAYRMRNAFGDYSYAVTYGKPDEEAS
ncbi:hypothetical protein ACFCZT_07695 [Streptomyces sp. NPDC056230]|uniref:hypothetical protein n=1 Tax=Streptomyces sp. NPDC056230 TaxID=3345754 RepID=UPI0035E196C0